MIWRERELRCYLLRGIHLPFEKRKGWVGYRQIQEIHGLIDRLIFGSEVPVVVEEKDRIVFVLLQQNKYSGYPIKTNLRMELHVLIKGRGYLALNSFILVQNLNVELENWISSCFPYTVSQLVIKLKKLETSSFLCLPVIKQLGSDACLFHKRCSNLSHRGGSQIT